MEPLIDNFIADIKRMQSYKKQIVHIQKIAAQEATLGELEQPLPENIQNCLLNRNISFYSHQAEAINNVRKGKNVVIVTPTASGKTLAFNIPVLEALTRDSKATALYLYPTKALANDQIGPLEQLSRFTGIESYAAIYDGDTPQSKRAAIRERSRIILSNPYELHQMLCWHAKWRAFLSGLDYIIIDEAHRYRGVFGSHIAFVIRRLLRLCRHYGSDPRFILSTATIANPREFAGNLTGQDFACIDNDGSPHGRKHFVLYNPFFNGIGEKSMHHEAKDLLISCVRENLQTLCFTGSRKMAELVTLWAREDARLSSARLADSISAYRAGFLPAPALAIRVPSAAAAGRGAPQGSSPIWDAPAPAAPHR